MESSVEDGFSNMLRQKRYLLLLVEISTHRGSGFGPLLLGRLTPLPAMEPEVPALQVNGCERFIVAAANNLTTRRQVPADTASCLKGSQTGFYWD